VTLQLRNGVDISVELTGTRELAGRFRVLSRQAKLEVAQAITRSALAIHAGAVRRCRGDTGRLRSSIRLMTLDGGLAAAVGTNVKYAKFVEFGTGPLGARTNKQPLPPGYTHGASHKMPPIAALIPWVRRHARSFGATRLRGAGFGAKVVNDQDAIRGLAFVIARKIKQRGGNVARPFLYPSYAEERPKFMSAIRVALRKAGEAAR